MKYLYVIEQAADGSFAAYVPDLPGCTTSAETREELQTKVRDAVATYIDILRETGVAVPAPTSAVAEVEAA